MRVPVPVPAQRPGAGGNRNRNGRRSGGRPARHRPFRVIVARDPASGRPARRRGPPPAAQESQRLPPLVRGAGIPLLVPALATVPRLAVRSASQDPFAGS